MATGFTWRGPQVAAKVEAAGARGVTKAAHRLRSLAVYNAPLLDGALRGSAGVVAATPGPDPVVALVYFDTPYAVRQHEELGYRHHTGGAKYLEGPLHEHQDELRGIIAAELRRAHT